MALLRFVRLWTGLYTRQCGGPLHPEEGEGGCIVLRYRTVTFWRFFPQELLALSEDFLPVASLTACPDLVSETEIHGYLEIGKKNRT